MDALSPRHPAQRISFMKAAQVGATEAGNNWIGFVIHHAPGPMLAVLPTVEMAKRTSRGRLDPLIADSPALRERVKPARSRDTGNSMLSKEFPGGIPVLAGANSATGLRSMPARYIFLDEGEPCHATGSSRMANANPASADEEGDPVTLAEARTTTFSHRRKVFMVSTPTIRGPSRIEREFEASDRRRYFVPCPQCGAMQWLQFERLRWAKGQPETAAYHCEGCEKPISEHHRTQMLERGEWQPTATSVDPHAIGFHIPALYSPLGWKSWVQNARDGLAAQGSDEMPRAARNTLLGETWVESRATRRKRDRTSWLIEHIVIPGGPEDPSVWDKVTALLGRTWAHESGAVMHLSKLAVDTGYEAPAVYAWSRAMVYAQATPIRGAESFNRSTPGVRADLCRRHHRRLAAAPGCAASWFALRSFPDNGCNVIHLFSVDIPPPRSEEIRWRVGPSSRTLKPRIKS